MPTTRGAGRVELAAALLTAAKANRICPDSQDPDLDPEALVGEARGLLRHCADPGPLVSTWLTGERHASY